MAKSRMDLSTFVGKLLEEDEPDLLKEGVRVLAQALMEAEVSSQVGAEPYERSSNRTSYRNGYRERRWDTRVGTIALRIPKVSPGTYFPALLEPRRRAERAMSAVIQEAYLKGVSTRKVDDLVKSFGMDGISKSEVSRICKELDAQVKAFLERGIDGEHPYVWLDATFHKVREAGRVISMATVVAVGVAETGERRVLGLDTGPSEDHVFWAAFLRSLVKRGLKGVKLVISDSHEGLKQAIAKILTGATWQRCRVHFMRNILSTVPKVAQHAVAALIRTIFSQPDHTTAMEQLDKVSEILEARFPKTSVMLREAAEDILAHLHFPEEHRRRLHSTNPLERLHKEIKRRSDVVGIFPDRASLMRLVTPLLEEQDDEWQVVDRRYFSMESMRKVYEEIGGEAHKELLAAIA